MSVASRILGSILDAIRAGAVRVTEHAVDAMRDDALTLDGVQDATTVGEVIEDYPNDFPFPSCLVLGASLVTCYRPDPGRWIDGRVRRP